MAYSYTERKRIRKSFGSRDSVLRIALLLFTCDCDSLLLLPLQLPLLLAQCNAE